MNLETTGSSSDRQAVWDLLRKLTNVEEPPPSPKRTRSETTALSDQIAAKRFQGDPETGERYVIPHMMVLSPQSSPEQELSPQLSDELTLVSQMRKASLEDAFSALPEIKMTPHNASLQFLPDLDAPSHEIDALLFPGNASPDAVLPPPELTSPHDEDPGALPPLTPLSGNDDPHVQQPSLEFDPMPPVLLQALEKAQEPVQPQSLLPPAERRGSSFYLCLLHALNEGIVLSAFADPSLALRQRLFLAIVHLPYMELARYFAIKGLAQQLSLNWANSSIQKEVAEKLLKRVGMEISKASLEAAFEIFALVDIHNSILQYAWKKLGHLDKALLHYSRMQ